MRLELLTPNVYTNGYGGWGVETRSPFHPRFGQDPSGDGIVAFKGVLKMERSRYREAICTVLEDMSGRE